MSEGRSLGRELMRAYRGGVTEMRYSGHAVAVCGRSVVSSVGDRELVVPMRSTAKPFFALTLLNFSNICVSDEELALFSSSHNGESYHVNGIRDALSRRKMSPECLILGRHAPIVSTVDFDPPPIHGMLAEPLQNNCSGKHAGLLILAQTLGQNTGTYRDPDGLALRQVDQQMTTLAREVDSPIIRVGDGCGLPTYGLSLSGIAQAYASLVDPDASPNRQRLARAFVGHGYAVGGQDRLTTRLAADGILAKEGFDGLFVVAFVQDGLGCAIAVKIDSGSDRVASMFLENLVAMLNDQRPAAPPRHPIYDQSSRTVGEYVSAVGVVEEILAPFRKIAG